MLLLLLPRGLKENIRDKKGEKKNQRVEEKARENLVMQIGCRQLAWAFHWKACLTTAIMADKVACLHQ